MIAQSVADIPRRRIELLVSQQRLDDSDISAAIEKMGREAVAQRMQGHALLDPGRIGCLMKQPAQLAGRHRPAGSLSAGE